MPVRFYEERDFSQIVSLDRICFSSAWNEKSWRESLMMEQYQCYVLEEEERLKGFLLTSAALDEGEILKIGVMPEERGRSCGESLLLAAFEQWKKQGVESIFLEVRDSNQAARRLYEKLGFEKLGIRKRYYSHPTEDALIYRKVIQ